MSNGTILAAIELLTALLTHAAKLSEVLRRAQSEGRELNDAEWAEIVGDNDAALARLVAEIERARTAGR